MKTKKKDTILLVEDEEEFRFLYRDILEYDGYTVLEAVDGQQGLEMTRGKKPDLVLLDLMLPKLYGIDVLRKIREDEKTKSIKVIILSVLDEPARKAQGLQAGADDYIIKGYFSPEQVLARVAEVLHPLTL